MKWRTYYYYRFKKFIASPRNFNLRRPWLRKPAVLVFEKITSCMYPENVLWLKEQAFLLHSRTQFQDRSQSSESSSDYEPRFPYSDIHHSCYYQYRCARVWAGETVIFYTIPRNCQLAIDYQYHRNNCTHFKLLLDRIGYISDQQHLLLFWKCTIWYYS